MIFERKHLRLAALGLIGWIVVETVLFVAATRTIGVLATLLFMALKGFGGLLLFVVSIKGALSDFTRPSRRMTGLSGAAFRALGALLILVPGFLAPLVGVALFSPSVRSGLLRLVRHGRRQNAREVIVSLERTEWREVSVRRPRRAPRKERSLAP